MVVDRILNGPIELILINFYTQKFSMIHNATIALRLGRKMKPVA